MWAVQFQLKLKPIAIARMLEISRYNTNTWSWRGRSRRELVIGVPQYLSSSSSSSSFYQHFSTGKKHKQGHKQEEKHKSKSYLEQEGKQKHKQEEKHKLKH